MVMRMDRRRERRRDGASVGRKPGVLWVSHSAEMHAGEQTDAPNVRRQRRAKRVRCTPGLGNERGVEARTPARQRRRADVVVLMSRGDARSRGRAGSWGRRKTLRHRDRREECLDGMRNDPRGGLAGGAALPPCRTGGKGVEEGEAYRGGPDGEAGSAGSGPTQRSRTTRRRLRLLRDRRSATAPWCRCLTSGVSGERSESTARRG